MRRSKELLPSKTLPARGKRARQPQSALNSFRVVGVGASAGGLEAFERLLKRLPADTGMAFVLVQHLDPKHESLLTEIFSRATSMPVAEVKDEMPVEPNHVYIIPPNTNLSLQDGVLRLARRNGSKTRYMPVDVLFRSLASVHKDKAIGVILSGTASDGTSGMKAIKNAGGITFAQDEVSAKYFGMPQSSIAAGVVDFVLSPEQIARHLARIGRHPHDKHTESEKAAQTKLAREREEPLNQLFGLLKESYGVDFDGYKSSTISRRIKRRMALKGIGSLKDYLVYVSKHPDELRDLYQGMFVGITSFFREPKSFEVLKKKVFPRILKQRSIDSPIRIWVPGCSTGEEVYSLAIALLEYLKDKRRNLPIEIFGTDLNEEAIKQARHGKYPKEIEANVGTKRFRRFFFKMDNGYGVSKVVRDLCVFSKHDLVSNPPFARMDLISCRNVLIYLSAPLQKRLIPLFHYSLRPSGFLMMGTAETVGGFDDLFAPVDRKHKIYAKKPGRKQPFFHFLTPHPAGAIEAEGFRKPPPVRTDFDRLKEAADLLVLNQYAPACVLVDESMEILHFRGHTGPYLEPAPGAASLNLFKMAREGLLAGLQTAIKAARRKNVPERSEGLRVESDGGEKLVNIQVVPIRSSLTDERNFLVLFEDCAGKIPPADEQNRPRRGRLADKRSAKRVEQLKQELAATKAYLQSVIEDQEAGSEELRSLNEESLSTNEELQSTTEELETSNEELQSANEELTTLNEELNNRNAQLNKAHNDILNLLTAMNMSIVFLDRDFRIQRVTPSAEKVLHLTSSDIGRPLRDVRLNVEIPDLERRVLDAVKSSAVKTQEMQDRDGRWLLLQTRPYMTGEHKIDGAIVALTDIHERIERTHKLEASEEEVRTGEERFVLIADALPGPFAFVDTNQCYQFCNKAFEEWFGITRKQLKGRTVRDVIGHAAYETKKLYLQRGLEGHRTSFEGYVEYETGRRFVHIDYLPTSENPSQVEGCYVFVHDLTYLKEEEFRAFVEFAPDAMIVVDSQGKIILANQQAAKMFGYAQAEMVGRGHEMLVPSAVRERHIVHRTKFLKKPAARPMGTGLELYGLRKNGSQFPVEISLSPIQTTEGVVVSSIIRDISERKQLEEARRQSAVLKERSRLVRDVHDNLAQGLTSIVLQLESGEEVMTREPQEAYKHIVRARDVARSSLEEARRSLVAMHAQIVHETNLPDAIAQVISDLRRDNSIQMELSLRGNPQPLSLEVQENLLQISQEALRNAVRHAKASEVRVELTYEPEAIGIRIEDNGRGFSVRKVRHKSGLGLSIMQERASELGAQIKLRSRPGAGTCVELRMPISAIVQQGLPNEK